MAVPGTGPDGTVARTASAGLYLRRTGRCRPAVFGTVSRGLASLIERAVGQWGLPNGYVLGEEAGGAFFGGLRYGEGMLYTKNAGDFKVFWQGPSLGWDFGGDGARTMVLVYRLPAIEAIYQRFGGRIGLFCWWLRNDSVDGK